MATPEPLVPSRRLQSAAVAERERLQRDMVRLDARANALTVELQKLNQQREEVRAQLVLLARLAAREDDGAFPSRSPGRAVHLQPVPTRAEPRKAVIRGARIREIAVMLLLSSEQPQRPIHYQQWYELLGAAGYAVAGRDPLATFLTQIGRSPVVRRAGAPGLYALDLDAPSDLRGELARSRSELLELASVPADSVEDVARLRGRRAALDKKTRAIERALEESLRALTPDAAA